jgi:uncharacterized membrane protein
MPPSGWRHWPASSSSGVAPAGPRVLPAAAWVIGLMLIGWGLFNFTEGLINHHLLGIHHVRGWGPNPVWDFGFLLSGPVLAGIGWLMVRRAAPRDPSVATTAR